METLLIAMFFVIQYWYLALVVLMALALIIKLLSKRNLNRIVLPRYVFLGASGAILVLLVLAYLYGPKSEFVW